MAFDPFLDVRIVFGFEVEALAITVKQETHLRLTDVLLAGPSAHGCRRRLRVPT